MLLTQKTKIRQLRIFEIKICIFFFLNHFLMKIFLMRQIFSEYPELKASQESLNQ